MRVRRGLLAPASIIVWLGACSDGTNPVTARLDIAGVWDVTATSVDSSAGATCSDTGSFVFNQTDSTFAGSARVVGVCQTRFGNGAYARVDSVVAGQVRDDTLGFSLRSCRYTASVATGTPQGLSGHISCGGATGGTWHAHRAVPVAAVTLFIQPSRPLRPNDTVWVYARLSDATGSRVFFRPVTWTSDHPTVATVAGTVDSVAVVAKEVGTATITATVDGQRASTVLAVVGLGAVTVTTSTSGVDLDADGYLVNLGGIITPIAVNAVVTFDSVVPGSIFVALAGIADNCGIVASSGGFVAVNPGDTTAVAFTVTCTAAGSIRVTTVTAGVDVPHAYPVTVDYFVSDSIAATGTVVFQSLGARSHIVFLDAPNHCAVTPTDPVTVAVTGGTTTDVAFIITCTTIGRIAYASNTQFGVVQADGSAFSPFPVAGLQPTWAPDGTRLAFSTRENTCGGAPAATVVCLMNADGTGVSGLPVPTPPNGLGQSWSPDGKRIAYVASGSLHAVKVDGSGDTTLTSGVVVEGFPAWSPDGSKIAFGCAVESGNSDICVVNADGTGLVRLTTDPAADGRPAWKPDGTAIAFSTTRYLFDQNHNPTIAVMNTDGSGVTAIERGDSPAWSPDGGRIAFIYAATGCCDTEGFPFTYLTLAVMRADGSGREYPGLASSMIDTPAWQP